MNLVVRSTRVPISASSRGTRDDRMLAEVRVSLPPTIAGLTPPSIPERDLARARHEAADLEQVSRGVLNPLAGFLIRMESVASSRIEHVEATPVAFARAIGGIKENESAMPMVAAGTAITRLIDASSETIALDEIIAFSNRDDIDPVMQAAIAHAQFESIHPFTDGNGRIDRALIGAILRRRGVTPHTVLPVASALATDTAHYFSLLTAYRSGNLLPIITDLALSVEAAAREARDTARTFTTYEAAWRERVAPRAGSAADQIMPVLIALPVFTIEQLTEATGLSDRGVYRGVQTLEKHQVVEAVTERVRDRAYAAMDVLDEFEDLDMRIRAHITRLRQA